MVHFTPASAAIGGGLIGVAAAFLWLCNGRIAGISGILGGLLNRAAAGELGWRVAFLTGLIGAPAIYAALFGVPPAVIGASPTLLVIAGLLVGFGTRLGGGCTSGHGVCGNARLSRRSLTATVVFMATAAATVFVTQHLARG